MTEMLKNPYFSAQIPPAGHKKCTGSSHELPVHIYIVGSGLRRGAGRSLWNGEKEERLWPMMQPHL